MSTPHPSGVAVALDTSQLRRPVAGGIGTYVAALVARLPGVGVDLETFSGSETLVALRQYLAWPRIGRSFPRGTVIHAPSLAVPPVSRRRPLVVTIHDLAFRSHPECFPPRGVTFHERGLARAAADAAVIVVPSQATADEVTAAGVGIGADRVRVVPHGIDADRDVAGGAGPVSGPFPPSEFILFVGTIEPRKGLDTLLAAHQQLRGCGRDDLDLIVAGPMGWGPLPDLVRPGVRDVGRVDPPTLERLYRRAAVVAVPSLTEGFGLPALEAMVRGAPVVASDAGALPEVVGDAGLLVPPGDADALAVALGRVLADPGLAREMSGAGKRRSARFSWSACLDGHLAAYGTALAGP